MAGSSTGPTHRAVRTRIHTPAHCPLPVGGETRMPARRQHRASIFHLHDAYTRSIELIDMMGSQKYACNPILSCMYEAE